VYLRPDLRLKMITSAILFTAFYLLYFLWFVLFAPGYVVQVWDMKVLSGVLIAGIPLEEILFAFGFGFFWSGIYDLYAWRKLKVTGFRFRRFHAKRSWESERTR
ncbi:MAG: lycopene cyclase domain-containing protein, partial [Methanoregulaceae archaeon]|nr:lycopene cyclase domain-containing protein [Methanoregulaceae archaeon]